MQRDGEAALHSSRGCSIYKQASEEFQIHERTEVNIPVFQPLNYTGTISLLMLIALVGSLVYLRRNNLSMISGQMWNHIRGPPFVQKTAPGGVAYIHGSSQAQFIMETYFVLVGMYGLFVLGMILLCETGDQKADPSLRRIQAMAGLGLSMFLYSLILSIFRSKAKHKTKHTQSVRAVNFILSSMSV